MSTNQANGNFDLEASCRSNLSMDRWRGKVAIVTGTSSGIGAAIAKKLVAEGMIVIGLSRRTDPTETLAASLSAFPGRLHAYACDVSSESSILSAFAFAKSLGPIHVLVNNAGLMHNSNLMSGDTAKWREVLDVNVLGLCLATREAIKDMRMNEIDGHVVHINSLAGYKVTQAVGSMYSPSKFAVTALSEALRLELMGVESKIKVTSICPGLTDTNFFLDVNGMQKLPKYAKVFARNPSIKSEDVADAVICALSFPLNVEIVEIKIKAVGDPS